MNTQEDPLVICSMGPGLWTRQGHFIVLWDVNNGVAHINDHASTSQPRTENSYKYMASQCKQYFCFNKPLPKETAIPQEIVEETADELVEITDIMPLNSLPLIALQEMMEEKGQEQVSPLLSFNKNNSYLF